ncbi:secreted RxLR effector protein 78-like [Silene latifolia]|uniref:secreted RxLR effector protein 78-like n=1 Tax=Silene latifolia TaxID=37657 RepID=UPI003D77FE01
MPSIISHNQQAFMSGCLISDGCLLAREIMNFITTRGTTCYAALKLDMNKAFDRVSWEFILSLLDKFEFSKALRLLIQQCITTVSYHILINGEPSDIIYPSCGILQGDPISPYIFIMCMEVLSPRTPLKLLKNERVEDED